MTQTRGSNNLIRRIRIKIQLSNGLRNLKRDRPDMQLPKRRFHERVSKINGDTATPNQHAQFPENNVGNSPRLCCENFLLCGSEGPPTGRKSEYACQD